MTGPTYDIIFRGDIVLGHQLVDVKLKLQQLFKADAAKIDALFTGRPVPLKRGLDQPSAQKYKEVLTNAGAQVELIMVGGDKPLEPRASTPQPQASQIQTESQPVKQPLTLAQRLALQEQAAKERAAAQAALVTTAPVQTESQSAAAQMHSAAVQTVNTPSWGLAPTGAELLREDEKIVVAPVIVDVSTLSVRPQEGNILDVSELPPDVVSTVHIPDLVVAAAGENLIKADEKMPLAVIEFDLDDWSIADVGTDLISAQEKPVKPALVIADLQVDLAPAGADLGQLKSHVVAVQPDISGLRLAD